MDRYLDTIYIYGTEAIAAGGGKTKKAVARQVLETLYLSIYISIRYVYVIDKYG